MTIGRTMYNGALLLFVGLLSLQGASAWAMASVPDPEVPSATGQATADTSALEEFDRNFREEIKNRKILQENAQWQFKKQASADEDNEDRAREKLLAFRALPSTSAPATGQVAVARTHTEPLSQYFSPTTYALIGVGLVILLGSYFALRHTSGESETLKDMKQQAERRKTQRIERQEASKRRSKAVDLPGSDKG